MTRIQVELWYHGQDITEAMIQAHLDPLLRECGFAVLHSARQDWNARVRLGRKGVFWAITARIENHICADLVVYGGDVLDLAHIMPLFHQAYRHLGLPVREARVCVGPSMDVPWFSMTRYRNMLPPVLVVGSDDDEQVFLPGEAGYWENASPELHVVSTATLQEPGVTPPNVWASQIGATVQEEAHGVVFDCGWTAWEHHAWQDIKRFW